MIRMGVWYFAPEQREGLGTEFHTIADALATGCLLAGFRDRLANVRILVALRTRFAFLLVICILAFNESGYIPRLYHAVGESVMNVLIAVLIAWCIRSHRQLPAKVLDSRAFRIGGTLSYSLYLWQQPFLNRHSSALICSFPLNVILAVLMAAVSYVVVERPFLALKNRVGRARSAVLVARA